MNRLAVIIPYHSTPAELESSLLSLLENRPENCEICVVLTQPYENIYELSEEEVLFLEAETQITEGNRSVADSLRFGLTACNSSYIYWMPAGVQFQSQWLEALEIMDQSEDLGAFFLDVNLTLGGFFRKPLLESFLRNSKDSIFHAESDTECLASLVSLMQDLNLPCGLAEFEIVEEEPEEEIQVETELSHESEPEINSKRENATESEIKPELKPEPKQEVKPELKPEPKQEEESEVELDSRPELKPEQEFELESEPEWKQFARTDFPEKTGLLARFSTWFRGFFK